jgi:hypothetical protein
MLPPSAAAGWIACLLREQQLLGVARTASSKQLVPCAAAQHGAATIEQVFW